MTEEKPSETRLHLKFSRIFVSRLRKYAEVHRMKLNAVVQLAFELLEDQPQPTKKLEVPDDY